MAKRRPKKPLSNEAKKKRKDRRRVSKERRTERDDLAEQHRKIQKKRTLERKTNYKLEVLSKLPSQRIRDFIQRCDAFTAPYGLASHIVARAFPLLFRMGLRFKMDNAFIAELRAIGSCRPRKLSIVAEKYDPDSKKVQTAVLREGEIPLSGLSVYKELYDEDPPVNKPEFIGMKAVYKYQLLIWVVNKTSPSELMFPSFETANNVLHAQSQAQLDEALGGKGFWKGWLSSATGEVSGTRTSGGKVKRARSSGGVITEDGTNLEMLTVEELIKRKEKADKGEQRRIRRLLRSRGHSLRDSEKTEKKSAKPKKPEKSAKPKRPKRGKKSSGRKGKK